MDYQSKTFPANEEDVKASPSTGAVPKDCKDGSYQSSTTDHGQNAHVMQQFGDVVAQQFTGYIGTQHHYTTTQLPPVPAPRPAPVNTQVTMTFGSVSSSKMKPKGKEFFTQPPKPKPQISQNYGNVHADIFTGFVEEQFNYAEPEPKQASAPTAQPAPCATVLISANGSGMKNATVQGNIINYGNMNYQGSGPQGIPFMLPHGWETAQTRDGQTYYMDHNTKTTTWDPPTAHTHMDPNRPPGHNSNADQAAAEFSTFLYQIVEEIGDASWLKFARTGLNLSDPEIERIEVDYKHSVEERKYQMLKLWARKDVGSSKREQMDKLKTLRDKFWNGRKK